MYNQFWWPQSPFLFRLFFILTLKGREEASMLFVCVRVRPSNQNSKCKAPEVRKSLVGQPLGEGETLPVVGVVGTFLRCRCQGCALSELVAEAPSSHCSGPLLSTTWRHQGEVIAPPPPRPKSSGRPQSMTYWLEKPWARLLCSSIYGPVLVLSSSKVKDELFLKLHSWVPLSFLACFPHSMTHLFLQQIISTLPCLRLCF